MPPSYEIGHRFIMSPKRETALAAAKELLEESRGKPWQQLVRERIGHIEGNPFCERLSSEELEANQSAGNAAAAVGMSGYHRDFYRTRSRSVDLSWISRSADEAANTMKPPKM
ncbi:hypothetical protein WR25_00746 [Diploscapter pachys]|uniref:Uncharacterized protein n=1 Tax=Diploscapter pachys TaxID=2018661 RepID=A0A2A2LEP4_9BILA|nr:hypothetical protein WR25_00746 [Diploscapter pachys]